MRQFILGFGRPPGRVVLLFAGLIILCFSAARVCLGQVNVVQNSSTNWTITNGALTVVFNPSAQNISSIQLGVGGGASGNLLNTTKGTLDQEFAGTPFGAGPQTSFATFGPGNNWVDVWTNSASTGTATNPITYAFHYVLFNNDPTIHVYEALSHSSTDPATSVGQGQFLFRSNPALFPNLYQVNTGPNNLAGQETDGIPSTNANFGTATAQAGRTVQNVTYDMTGSGVPGDNGTNFFTKYDYSTYSQFYQAETAFGSQYAVSEVVPSSETLTGGPTKQELAWTDPGILNMEFLSDHYGIDGKNGFPGYGYTPPTGVNSTKLFGPYAFRIESSVGKTGAQINQDALDSIQNYQSLYDGETVLGSNGYVASGSRGTVKIGAANTAGWSATTNNNTVVLSDQNVNMQESHQGYQYWSQIASNGTATINAVAPGFYRMTLYQLGQWGETRVDGVQVINGLTNIPQQLKFTPENFGAAPPIWTIGTPDRSAHEFMNFHTAGGQDLRQFYGAYDMWAEQQAMGTPGKVVYYATSVGATPATNDPNKWIGNQWQTFNPGLYDSSNGTSDNYANLAPSYVRDAAHGGTGPGPANYHGSPWEVHFAVTAPQVAQGQYVVLSVGSVSLMASLVVGLNGHSETWSYGSFTPNDPQVRSGDSGFYQWAAFQFPVADLNAVGADNVFTFSPSAHADGVMYDALRMEITNISADPAITGWADYNFINGNTQVGQNDALGLNANNAFVPEPGSLLLLGAGLAVTGIRPRRSGKRDKIAQIPA